MTTAPHSITFSGVLLFLLSIIYLLAEIHFNMSLLDVAGDVRSSPAAIEDLQHFGRSVSAFGCCLLVLGVYSATGFRLRGRRHWAFFWGVAVFVSVPFVLVVLQMVFGTESGRIVPLPELKAADIFMSLCPFMGILFVLMSRGQFPFHSFCGMILMVWPAVFLGQKLLIEEMLIERTGWEERVNARYVLMLRSGMESCSINLGDLELCNGAHGQDNVKAARIILSSLWMLYPEGIRQDMETHRDSLTRSFAARSNWFSTPELYRKYVDEIAGEHMKVEDDIFNRLYVPYRKVSDIYLATLSPAVLRGHAEKASAEIEKGIDEGWRKYQNGVAEYNRAVSARRTDLLRQAAPLKSHVDRFCANRRCPDIGKKAAQMVATSQQGADSVFMERTGYTPDIRTRDEFIAAEVTQIHIRNEVEQHIHKNFELTDFSLPLNWRYDRDSFHAIIESLLFDAAQKKWTEKFGNRVSPGLSYDAFLAQVGVEPLPPLEKVVMSQEDFFESMILPQYRKIIDNMLDTIDREKEQYANGAPLAQTGKDFARAVYVPVIALIISLIVVLLTVMRWGVVFLLFPLRHSALRRYAPPVARRAVQTSLMAGFAALVVLLPSFSHNPYAAGMDYQRYLTGARAQHPVMAAVLDWTMHAQPVIYRFGGPFRAAMTPPEQRAAVKQTPE